MWGVLYKDYCYLLYSLGYILYLSFNNYRTSADIEECLKRNKQSISEG